MVPELPLVAAACRRQGARLLVDAYHHLNVAPFDVAALDLEDAFVTGGGYKYCQLGEGNCFLRVPAGCDMRPIVTGWYAELAALDARPSQVAYEPGAAAFAGATYDPTSHYRAAAVFDFFQSQRLTPERLRLVNQRQVGMLRSAFEALDLDPAVAHVEAMPEERRGGFLAIRAAARRRRSARAAGGRNLRRCTRRYPARGAGAVPARRPAPRRNRGDRPGTQVNRHSSRQETVDRKQAPLNPVSCLLADHTSSAAC
jgi:kynureninase